MINFLHQIFNFRKNLNPKNLWRLIVLKGKFMTH